MSERSNEPVGADRDDHAALESALMRLGGQVDVPPAPDYAGVVVRRLQEQSADAPPDPRPAYRRPVLIAAAVVALLLGLASVPAGRDAVASLFGLDGVRVLRTPPSSTPRTTLDPGADFGAPVTLAEAQALVSFPIALPSYGRLGAPDRAYVRSAAGLESVTLIYRPSAAFPAVVHSRVGLVLSEYAGSATPYFDKYVDDQRPPRAVTVAGQWPGLRFPGPQQVLIRDDDGAVHNEHARVSAPTLVWVEGAVTYRLEARISLDRALDVAASVD